MAQDHHKHTAIYALYSNVAYIRGDENGIKAYDADDNEIAYDANAVNTKADEVEADRNLELLREKRNEMLETTDHWDASDTPSMTQAQIDYRQALRDITNSYTSLDDVVWPTKP